MLKNMPGPEKSYPYWLQIRVDQETRDNLDRKRGDQSRSEWVRSQINDESPSQGLEEQNSLRTA